MIYFAQGRGGGPIKIGSSYSLCARINEVAKNCGRPLRVLATMPGGRVKEGALHKQFAHLRMANCVGNRIYDPGLVGLEWFYPAVDLLEFIRISAREFEVPNTRQWRKLERLMNDRLAREFGRNLREIREDADRSRRGVARAIGVEEGMMRLFEIGAELPSRMMARKLAKVPKCHWLDFTPALAIEVDNVPEFYDGKKALARRREGGTQSLWLPLA
jgi:transcriptional regulator with XRE-family HTH domain